MATPSLQRYRIPGALGDILIDIRTAEWSAPAPTVVIIHGFKGFKDWGMFPRTAERLARAGFTAVSFNLSGSGVDDSGEFVFPDRFGRNTFSAEQADIRSVVAALRDGTLGVAPPVKLGLVGHSRGGGGAILAAEATGADALVTWAAVSTVRRWGPEQVAAWRDSGRLDIVNSRTGLVLPLRTDVLDDIDTNASGSLDIEAAAARIAVPWLLVHGVADETVPVAEADRLAAVRPPIDGSALLRIEGGGHTFGAMHPLVGSPEPIGRVIDETVRFLSRTLGAAA